ncbi:hypothetical protein NQ315_013036, partial [Exocentrus adspersus]
MTLATCAVIKGDLPVEIFWTLNGKSIETVNGINTIKTKERVSQLSIDDVQAHHAGEYMCIVRNRAGNTTYSTYLHVNVPPQISHFDFGDEAVNAGDIAATQCTVIKGDFPLNITWVFNNKPLTLVHVAPQITPFDFGENEINVGDSTSLMCSIHKGDLPINISWLHNNISIGYINGVLISKMVAPQIVPFDFGDDPINSGDFLSVQCSVHKGDLPINISWLHNNISIGYIEGVVISKVGKKVSTVTIDSVQENHAGVYTCLAENKAGKTDYSAKLNVNVPPQILPFDFGEESANSGDMASLQCSVFKGDLPNGRKMSSLSIENVSEEHSGAYTCLVENAAGLASYSAHLHVNVAPQILPFDFGEDDINLGDFASLTCSVHKGDLPINISWLHNNISIVPPQILPFTFGEESANSGDMASLTCSVFKGDLPVNITWLHNNKTVSYDMGITVFKNGKKMSSLSIENVGEEHSGVYTCLVQNVAGVASYSVHLHVNVPPNILPFDFGEDDINLGDFTSLSCSVHKGDLPINISWLHNNISIGYIDGILVSKAGRKVSTVTIDSVQEYHAGEYTCVAENVAGTARYSVNLQHDIVILAVPPQILPFDFGEESVNSGDVASLQCTIFKGDFPLNITWLHNNSTAIAPQILPFDFGEESVNYGDVASLQCTVFKGDFPLNITWLHDNQTIDRDTGVLISKNVAPQILTFDFGEDSINTGDLASLTCSVHKGDLPMNITWFHNNRTIGYNEGILISTAGKKISTLSIDSVQEEHTVSPQLLPLDFGEDVVNTGESTSLMCSVVKGDLPIDIIWLHNNDTVENDDTVSVVRVTKKTSTLNIDSVQEMHAGRYSCIAKNAAGYSSHSTDLHVNVPPQINPFDFGEDPINSGDIVSLTCSVNKGDLPLDLTWEFNGASLKSAYGVTINMVNKRLSTLSIDSVQADNAGEYKCIAKNSAVPPQIIPFDFGEDSTNTDDMVSATCTVHKGDFPIDIYWTLNNMTVNKIEVPPQIIPFDFGEDETNSDDMVSVTCTVHRGDFPIDIYWTLNNITVDKVDGISVMRTKKRISQLSIDSVQAHHSGEYTCHAKNPAGVTTHSAVLHVNVLPHITPFSFEGEVNRGDSVQITCYINKGDVPVSISWMLNGETVTKYAGINVGLFGKKSSVLSIDSIDQHHAGNYTCIASNVAGISSYSSQLIVRVLPKIHPFNFGDEASSEGETISVQCTISSGDLPIKFSWLLNGQPLPEFLVLPRITPFYFEDNPVHAGHFVEVSCTVSDGDLPIEFEWQLNGKELEDFPEILVSNVGKRTSFLSIESVSYTHAGNYTCKAKNRAGETFFSSALQVNVVPQIAPFDFGHEPVHSGQSVQVQCFVSEGDLPVTFKWSLNEEPLEDFPQVSVLALGKRSSILSIDSVTYTHAGNYTCRATNRAGEVTYSAELQVNVPPQIAPFDFGEDAVNSGDMVNVFCTVNKGDLPIGIKWTCNGKLIDNMQGITITRTSKRITQLSIDSVQDFHRVSPGDYKDFKPNNPDIKVEDGTLTINNIQKTNEGYYLCEAVNGIGSGLSAVILISVQAPPQFEVKYRNQTSRRGEPAVLQCEAKGEKPIGILWNINNKRLEPKGDNRYTIREEILPNGVLSDLSIRRTERTDSAIFTCVATNAFGSSWDKNAERVLIPGDQTEAGAHYRSHSTWDPRRHLYEELRSRRGSNETVHTHR